MRFALTDEQIEFSEAVRTLLENTCTPDDVRSAWDDAELAGGGSAAGTGRVPAAWSALAEMGVLGIMAPESAGGLDMSDEDLSPLVIEAGRVALPDPLSATAGVAVAALRACLTGDGGDAEAKATELLAGICDGSISVGITFDSAAGVASSSIVPSIDSIDTLLVFGEDSVTAAPSDAIDFEILESTDRARRVGRVNSANGSSLLSGPEATRVTTDAFNRAALYSASELIGLSDRMVELAVGYASERQQFGVPIGSFQAVKHHLANAAMRVEFARPLVMRAAHSIANGDPDASVHVSMAKARAAQAADGAARVSLQVHGGIGYTVEYDLHLYMKRSWALAREFGDAKFHTRRVRNGLGLG